ncbi:hypothetical protein NE237_006846 [Protea cynaroides]|uniref:Uncharacterized protein n=1 Tax=Protea cynaroides TaxID=273540 RepID=A0A9Q0KN54_9MAGN|nr:hypothetical protein NE237_006846 [Protea cynaroides]
MYQGKIEYIAGTKQKQQQINSRTSSSDLGRVDQDIAEGSSSHCFWHSTLWRCFSSYEHHYRYLMSGRSTSGHVVGNQHLRGPLQFFVRLGPKVSATVNRKLRLSDRILQEGGLENLFKQIFNVRKGEKLCEGEVEAE